MPNRCFIFPGQGSQFVGMGKSLYDNYEEAKALMNKADSILGFSLSGLCFNGPEDELNLTKNSQLALLVVSLAAFEVIKVRRPDIEVNCFGGLSLGEYSALVASGVFSFDVALNLVRKRSELMQKACDNTDGGMVSVIGLARAKVEEICQEIPGYMVIANLNCPGQIVVSGEKKYLESVAQKAKESGARLSVVLKVAGAFHSDFMKEAAVEFKSFLSDFECDRSNLGKVLSNLTGRFHDRDEDWRENLSRQMMSPVLWEENMNFLIQNGTELFYELGSGKLLSGLLKRINKSAACLQFDGAGQLDSLT